VNDHAAGERVAANLAAIRSRIDAAAARAGRSPDGIRLIAVSKTFGPDAVRAAYAAGQRAFGENKVQEALAKAAATADLDIDWHLIGHLQGNKARKAAGGFAWIQTLDRMDLLHSLDEAAVAAGTSPRLLIQVDLAGEDTKHGLPPDAVRPLLDAAAGCRAVSVTGLMLLPPWSEDPEASRPWFGQLRAFRETLLGEGVPPAMLAHLSMGMSHDFEVAIEEGATIVRIGTALFGQRTYQA
jgi:PLP dependent protein